MTRQRINPLALFCVTLTVIACAARPPVSVPAPPPAVAPTPAAVPPPVDGSSSQLDQPRVIVGAVDSANFSLMPQLYPNPTVVLLDVSNQVKGDRTAWVSDAAQIMGTFTKPLFPLPGRYRVDLPIQPQANAIDLDNDGQTDAGVQMFALVVASNLIGNSFLQQLEQASGQRSYLTDPTTGAIAEGTFVLYATDDQQSFPTSAGLDGKWFSGDEPVMALNAGYTVVTLEPDGTVHRNRLMEVTINTVERKEVASPDFSKQGIAESFDSLIDVLKQRYAYTALRKLDWDQIRANYLSQVKAADKARDTAAYFLVLDDLAKSIHDAHVSVTPNTNVEAIVAQATALSQQIAGGVGATAIAVSDVMTPTKAPGDKIVVLTVGEDGPAKAAGWVPGTEILSIDGQPAAARYDAVPQILPTGTDESKRALQTPQLLRFPMSQTVTFGYRLPNASEVLTTTMTAGEYDAGDERPPATFAAPISYERIGEAAIVRWNDFVDVVPAKIAVLEEALAAVAGEPATGVVLDLRGNTGGWTELYQVMASYFFTAGQPMPTNVFDWYTYDQSADDFVRSDASDYKISAPRPELAFTGPLVVLIDEKCASSCEYFTQHLQVLKRATVIGQYSSRGAGGPIDRIAMPGDLSFQYTVGRTTFAGTDVFNLEAKGVVPDVRVPVTLETETAKLKGGDPVMRAALAALEKQASAKP
jgi:C-terminal processing protease CtpA/Prc